MMEVRKDDVRPLILGLADGVISTVAPIFAAAIASGSSLVGLKVGTAACLGAAISMGVAEALSEEGEALRRGVITGVGTFLGGFAHTLPFVIPHLGAALVVGTVVVVAELLLIAWVRKAYFPNMSWTNSLIQVTLAGIVVFLVGVFVGDA